MSSRSGLSSVWPCAPAIDAWETRPTVTANRSARIMALPKNYLSTTITSTIRLRRSARRVCDAPRQIAPAGAIALDRPRSMGGRPGIASPSVEAREVEMGLRVVRAERDGTQQVLLRLRRPAVGELDQCEVQERLRQGVVEGNRSPQLGLRLGATARPEERRATVDA